MNIIYYMNMTDNKTRTITYYKLKHVDDDTTEWFIYSALSIKQLRYKQTQDKGSYVDRYIRKNGGKRKWEFVILETKPFETSQKQKAREYELHIEHNIKPSVILTYACRVYKNV